MIDVIMSLITSIWVGIWLLFGIALCVLGFIFSPYLIVISVVIIPAHAYYFLRRKDRAPRIPFFILLFLNSLLFLSAVALMNSEGTTWGNSSAWMGFAFAFPAFSSILIFGKTLAKRFSSWCLFLTGATGTAACIWMLLEVAHKTEVAGQDQTHIYWAPDAGLQQLALILSGFLLINGFVKILSERKLPTQNLSI